jgi:hypothetical protein
MKIRFAIALLSLIALSGQVNSQEILFDQMVEAGGLKCYPVHGDPNSWYYLPDQPHVATTGEAERPEFSFLMYTMPEQRGEEGITTAPGGGVAHMLVAYDAPEDMVRRAQSELQRQKAGAQLKGPVSYTDGTFNLITAVTDPEAGLMRRVVGVGNAPVMSGHKAAVSMHLTPTGAMLLWESFEQRTPDISVNFEMTVSGYRNPVEATMTFNYQRIHQTMELEAGIESRYLEADIDVMLGKMVDSGAINIELKGAPPEQWAEVQKLGLELAKHHLFENMGAAPLSQVTAAARAARSGSSSSRSGSSGGSSTGATPRPTSSSSSGSSSRPSATPTPTPRSSGSSSASTSIGDHGVLADRDRVLVWAAAEHIEMVALPPPDLTDGAQQVLSQVQREYRAGLIRQALNSLEGSELVGTREGHLWTALCQMRLGNRSATEAALRQFIASEGVTDNGQLSGMLTQVTDSQDGLWNSSPDSRQTRETLANSLLEVGQAAMRSPTPTPSDDPPSTSGGGSTSSGGSTPRSGSGGSRLREEVGGDDLPLRRMEFEDEDEPELRRIQPSDRERPALRGTQQEEDPIRVKVSFKLRRIERSGSFVFNMKQWNRVELPVRFAANIGDLARYKSDPRMFRRVSLNDPMFKQREIPVSVDVASEEAFAAMLNAVTVTLRKRHQSGKETLDEVTIQRADFASGEMNTLLYGWDGDDDRTAWLDYDHRVRWAYAGGPVIETDWLPTSAGAMVLSPPLRPRELVLEADPVLLREQGVRAVVVQVDYDAAGTSRTAHASIRPSSETGSHTVVLYQDPQQPEYTYSFDWRLYGGERMSAGPHDDISDFIFVDEIPRTGGGS